MFNGVVANGAAIIIGSLIGAIFRNITDEMKDTVTMGLSIGIVAIGFKMSLETQSFILVIVSLSIGAMLGEWWQIETKMNQAGLWLDRKVAGSHNNFAEGFTTASLLFVIGSMGIVGSIQSGVTGDHSTLYTKAVMDGFFAIMLTASLGVGVFASFIPVVVYQGFIVLIAHSLLRIMPETILLRMMNEIGGIGGLMIVGIGLNLLKLTKIRVSNFLPGILVLLVLLSAKFLLF